MRIVLNRFTARLFLLLLAPLVFVIRLARRRKALPELPDYHDTIDGDPVAYAGERPLVVSVWSASATVWRVATAPMIERLRAELAGRCEFAYVNGDDWEEAMKYALENTPTVIVRHRGAEVARFVNLLEDAPLRDALKPLLSD